MVPHGTAEGETMTRYEVSEQVYGQWRAFAIIPAKDEKTAIATARRCGMRPAARPMKATKQTVTKR